MGWLVSVVRFLSFMRQLGPLMGLNGPSYRPNKRPGRVVPTANPSGS